VPTRRLPFFVYGTLLPGERNHHLLAGRTLSWMPAEVTGVMLFHGSGRPYPYPYAVPDPVGAGRIRGQVASVADEAYEEVLAALDRLEGYVPRDPANRYERVAARVWAETGEIEAWMYVAAEPTAGELLLSGVRVPYGDWLRREGESGV
jgi:gamma-glutamylcyclotransferase (GGCT)/AIG2-like uncharacterized protein YtfP